MTKEEVIAMAREAGFDEHHAQFDLRIERFAKLVRNDYSNKHAQLWLKRIDEAVMAERAAMMQLFTDPENQPTQYGTVTVEYMQREIAAEREAYTKGWTDPRTIPPGDLMASWGNNKKRP